QFGCSVACWGRERQEGQSSAMRRLLVLRHGAQFEALNQRARPYYPHGTTLAPQRVADDIELLLGRLGHIQQQPFAAADNAMAAPIAAQPILPNFVSQSPGGFYRLLQ